MPRSARFFSLAALAVGALVGCGEGNPRTSPSGFSGAADTVASSEMAAAPMAVSAKDMVVGRTAQGSGTPSSNAIADSTPKAPNMVIRNGFASVQVDSLEPAIAAVQQMAVAYGGFVGNTSLSAGEYQVRSATLELKIPSARFDAALNGLKPIGKVESVSTTAEDVGEEFVDVSARVANAKRLEERLVTLLATRTGKLEDVLAVERELARVREEVERYEGRLRYLRTRVAMSTLTVTVHERAPLVSPAPGQNIMVEAFKNAWRNFVRFVAGFVSLLGILVPMLLLLGAAFGIGRKMLRRRTPPG